MDAGFLSLDGRIVPVLALAAVGALVIWRMHRRIEQLRQANSRLLRERRAAYEFLDQIGARMSAPMDFASALESIVEFLVSTTRAQSGALFLMDSGRQRLNAQVIVGMFPPFQAMPEAAVGRRKLIQQKIKSTAIPLDQPLIGEAAARGEPILIARARQAAGIPQIPGFEVDTAIAAPLKVRGQVEGVLVLVNRIGGEPFSTEDLSIVTAVAEQAGMTLQMVRLYDSMAEKQRMEQEIHLAQDFQKMLLPREFPRIPGVEIAAANLPAFEVGGDYYDFFWLDPHRLGIVIADVAGKGLPGGLIMSMVRSILRAESPHAPTPRAALERVNQAVFADTRDKVFITMVFAVLDCARKTLTFARAGHEPLVIFSRRTQTLRLLAPEGIALGLVPASTFSVIQDMEVPVEDGDVVALYTDGINEAMDDRGREYGQERFLDMLRVHADSPPDRLVRALVDDVRRHARGGRQSDDLTLVVLQFNQWAGCARAVETAETASVAPGQGGHP